ncbi:M23 family metallopeptidase [Streptomyces sp. WMMC897]|uniref:M23 family metallopeptidase n=1 Tax=Streptomyces sp. WMMC897 TaxID=3014782 RepID=UPI0022B7347B|nr:peptidoglycan DD-metalloendopeptidase family protein [Streptomyces sp. WMMC897]MCZ7415377.1 peptidoglycan DD-metalloendopeptidase family protein [Streptomyces sp. WMMC897]
MQAHPQHRRARSLPLLLAGTALAAALTGGTATATPPRPPGDDPAGIRPLRSAQHATADAARISRQAGRVTERYRQARAAAERQRRTVDALTGRLERKRAEYERLRQAVGAAAASEYRTGTALAEARVVVADSPEEFLAASAYVNRSHRAAARLAETTRQARADLAGQKAKADRALSRLRAEEARRHRLKRQVDAQLQRARARAARLRERASAAPAPRNPREGSGRWVRPVASYALTAGYAARGARWFRGHTGQDFAVPTGTPVRAVGPGTVVRAGYAGAYGNEIVVRHGDRSYTHYAHLSVIQVGVGQRLCAGQQIALSGSTGNSSGPHLHFEVRRSARDGSHLEPVGWLRAHGVVL